MLLPLPDAVSPRAKSYFPKVGFPSAPGRESSILKIQILKIAFLPEILHQEREHILSRGVSVLFLADMVLWEGNVNRSSQGEIRHRHATMSLYRPKIHLLRVDIRLYANVRVAARRCSVIPSINIVRLTFISLFNLRIATRRFHPFIPNPTPWQLIFSPRQIEST